MGAIAFLVLFVLGFLLATVGGIVGLVDAFRVSPVWGLLSLFVPFALLVYCIKFWGRKWARNGLIMSLGGLGVMLLSTPLLGAFIAQRAGQFGTSIEENMPTEGAVIDPVPVPDQQVATEEFAEPLVPVAPQLSPIARADLIQSTDPNERLQQINSNRTDPFAAVPIPPPPQVFAPPPPPSAPAPGAATPAGGGGGGVPGRPGSAVAAAPGTPGGSTPGSAVAATPGTPGGSTPRAGAAPGTPGGGAQPGTLPIAPLPALPQPTLAEAVLVSGVMTIGNENFAVVETAAGSQYVRAGQRVANGQVLVKRIEVRGSDPVVVFEQNGIEVSRPVGAAPPTAADEQPSA
ncbi:MAG: hypothetical protein WBA99_04800 [Nodosilinea sp.]